MERQRFTATFCGGCYAPAYGRKFYKHAVKLCDIRNSNGEMMLSEAVVSKSKKLAKFLEDGNVSYGSRIVLSAVLVDRKFLYLSGLEAI